MAPSPGRGVRGATQRGCAMRGGALRALARASARTPQSRLPIRPPWGWGAYGALPRHVGRSRTTNNRSHRDPEPPLPPTVHGKTSVALQPAHWAYPAKDLSSEIILSRAQTTLAINALEVGAPEA
jgi:hypothetical protein